MALPPVVAGLLAAQGAVQGIAGVASLGAGLMTKVDERKDYEIDPTILAQQREAALRAQGRMAQAGAIERTQQQSAAATQAQLQRAATDSSSAFLGAASVGAQRQQAGLQLAQLEAADQARRQAMADQAGLQVAAERRMVFQDQLNKRAEQIATRQQLIGGGLANIAGGFGTGANIGMLEGQYDLMQAQAKYYNEGGGYNNPYGMFPPSQPGE